MPTSDASRLAEYMDDYPRCYARGLLSLVCNEPRVLTKDVMDNFTPAEHVALDLAMTDRKLPLEGYYAWDVERLLERLEAEGARE